MRKQGDDLTVGQAARLPGVSPWTLRYWDRTDKLKPTRHPLSGYRLYRREQLDDVLRKAAGTGPAADAAFSTATKTTGRARGKVTNEPR